MMKQNKKRLFFGVLSYLMISNGVFAQEDILVDDPKECTKIAEDRARLVCFDRFFETPIFIKNISDSVVASSSEAKPYEWNEAWEKEKQRSSETQGFLQNVTKGGFVDSIVLTQPIENTGLLVLSCIDKISRVELMLNQPVKEGVVPVRLEVGSRVQSDNWLSDDSGYILRMGRGIPSINWMKSILPQNSIVLMIQDKSVVISIDGLPAKIGLLRETCRW